MLHNRLCSRRQDESDFTLVENLARSCKVSEEMMRSPAEKLVAGPNDVE